MKIHYANYLTKPLVKLSTIQFNGYIAIGSASRTVPQQPIKLPCSF